METEPRDHVIVSRNPRFTSDHLLSEDWFTRVGPRPSGPALLPMIPFGVVQKQGFQITVRAI